MSQHNYDVAIMNMLNELGGRYGLKPYDFSAVVCSRDERPHGIEVRFESAPNDDNKEAALDRMLTSLGIPNDPDQAPRISGSEADVYNIIEAALQRAPRQARGR